MKKLWLTCGLLLTMAVCGNNRVLAGTPESSDTIFMRFEKYNYLKRYGYDGNSWAGKGRVDFSVNLGKDVVFAEKSSKSEYPIDIVRARVEVKTADGGIAIWMAYGTGKCDYYPGYDEPRGGAVLSVRFPDSLVGKDFTVKFYDYEYGQSWSSASSDYSKVEFYRVSGISGISVDDSSNLVEISIRGSGFCAALATLKCCNNQLTSLDVNGCSALWTLLCYNNHQLTSLDVGGCTALKKLYCRGNQLESLDVSSCTALEFLDCEYNQLESLDVSRCTALEILYCGYNQLESLDVSGCTALEILDCDYNQLESLEVSGCTALEFLDCEYNQLESLDVGGCPISRGLYCSHNQLTSLELGLYHKLSALDCSDNQLTFLDLYDISNMEACLILDNHISELLYTGEAKMAFVAFGNNCLPLHKCHELSKWLDVSRNGYCIYGGSQYVPVSLGINEHYDLHADMELDGVKTTLKVTRKGGGYLDPKLYSVENGWLSFSEKGEYTVEMTNPKLRDHAIEDNGYTPISTALVSVFLDVRVGMPDEPNEPNDPNDPNNPNNPNNPDNPNDPNSPNNPDNPTTANEAGGTLTTAALQVYPNPATDVLHVELLPSAASESLQVVRVLSQSGHLCHSFGSGFDNLPVADLPAGLYFIEAETTTGAVLRQKFVKR